MSSFTPADIIIALKDFLSPSPSPVHRTQPDQSESLTDILLTAGTRARSIVWAPRDVQLKNIQDGFLFIPRVLHFMILIIHL